MIKAIVTDIEGTTSALSFVKDVLFPYARQHLAAFVTDHGQEPAVRQLLKEAKQEAGNPDLSDAQLIAQLQAWIDADRKVTPLKSLQGLIWEHGYRSGAYRGHVYDDAADKLRQWHAAGIKLYVYSSGSVYAQKLLFAHTEYGDLTPLFSGYFDTHVGHKREAAAYHAIARQLELPAGDILFLSDIEEELDAARDAGMQTRWLVRDGTPQRAAAHEQVTDFAAISLPDE
jgi:enolase-phosphatase E1